MATVHSGSTEQEILDAYLDNASYEEDDSTAKAKAFITACRVLLVTRPTSVSTSGYSLSFNTVEDEMNRARRWLSTKNAAGSVRHLSFARMRD